MKILETFKSYFSEKIVDINSLEDIKKEISKAEQSGKMTLNFLEDYFATIDFDNMTMKVVRETKRSIYGHTQLYYYRYRNVERMIESLENTYNNILSDIKRKEEKSKARKNIINPFKVDDILYDSWGYDQTNIDFYQVVRVSPKSVWIRAIAGQAVEGSSRHGDYGKIKPIKDHFIDDEIMRKPLQIFSNGKPYVSSRHGAINKYEEGEEGVYYSWGY